MATIASNSAFYVTLDQTSVTQTSMTLALTLHAYSSTRISASASKPYNIAGTSGNYTGGYKKTTTGSEAAWTVATKTITGLSPGTKYNYSAWLTVGATISGTYIGTMGGSADFWTKAISTYTLDLNGLLDGVESGNIAGYGTANVTVGGVLQGSGVSDYSKSHTANSSYTIDHITPLTGHTYNGLASGSAATSGTLNENKNVRLSFTTNTYTIYYDANGGTYSGDSTSYRYNASGIVSLSSTLPTKTYASFSGWRYENTIYPAGGSFPANKAMDVTVTAVWSPVVPTNVRVSCLTRTTDSLAMQVTYNAIDVTNIKLYYKRSQDENFNYIEIEPSVNMTILNNLEMDTNYDFYAEVTNAAGTGSSLD